MGVGLHRPASNQEMSFRIIPGLAAIAALCASAWAGQGQSPSPHQSAPNPVVKAKHARKVSARKKVEPPPPPQPPPPPPTLEQQPPVAPQVTYSGGQLTINAPNSRLSDVIAAVRRATGISFDGATSDERVAVRLGPGSPHDVINALLHGSHFDYVIVGADNDPAGVQRVLLTAPSSAPPTQPATVVTQNAPRPNVNPLPPNPNTVDQGDMNNTDEMPPDETVTEPPPENANIEGNPNNQDQENNQNNGEVQNNDENQQQQPKTPQQLLQELQQLQQQQNQQNQQNQNQPVPPGQPMPNPPQNPNQNNNPQQPPP
jgi:hypothetical protein